MRALLRLCSVAVPLVLWLAIPLSVFLRGQASGEGFGPNSHDALRTSALTWAVLDLAVVLPLLVLRRAFITLVLPPVVATVVMGAAWLGSGTPAGGVLDFRLIDLVNLPAALVMNGASQAGGAQALFPNAYRN